MMFRVSAALLCKLIFCVEVSDFSKYYKELRIALAAFVIKTTDFSSQLLNHFCVTPNMKAIFFNKLVNVKYVKLLKF